MAGANRRQRRPTPLIDQDGKGTPELVRFIQENAPGGGGGGGVSSVGMTAPGDFTVGGSPITSSGVLALSWNNVSASGPRRRVFAGPPAGSATPSFQLLESQDLPSHTHQISDILALNDALAAKANYFPWVSATANLPSGAGVYEYEQTITDAGVTAASVILLRLDPATDADENQAEGVSLLSMTAYPAAGSFVLNMQFQELHSGPIKLSYQVT